MAKMFYGLDSKTNQQFVYVYGVLNQHSDLIDMLEGMLRSTGLNNSQNSSALKWLVDEEKQLLHSKMLKGYEFLVCPFTDGKGIKNLPFLRLVFTDGTEYVRKYDDLVPLKISLHNPSYFLNPITRDATVEIVRIEEAV